MHFFINFLPIPFILFNAHAEVTSTQNPVSDSSWETSSSCNLEERTRRRQQLKYCHENWEEWGILVKPNRDELLDPQQCIPAISLENGKNLARGCAEALMAIPALFGELTVRGMLALSSTDKTSLNYIASYGSLQDMQNYYAQEFFRKKCKLAAEDEGRFLDNACRQPGKNVDCSLYLKQVEDARRCRDAPATRIEYREKKQEMSNQAAALYAEQQLEIKNQQQKQGRVQFIKDKCNPHMNRYSQSYTSMILNPLSYLAKSGQNLVWPSERDIQKYNICIQENLRGDLELQKKLQKKSAGLVNQIADRIESLKCYKPEIQLKVKCDIAIALLTGGAGLGRYALSKIGKKSLDKAIARQTNLLGAKNIAPFAKDAFTTTTQLVTRSRFVKFYNMNGPLKETIEPGSSYTVLVRDEKLILGKGIIGQNGIAGGPKSHRVLEDVSKVDVDDIGADGALRFNTDGSIDISGYHNGQLGVSSAQEIKELVLKIAPEARIRTTGDRLSTLSGY